jgi:acyl-CoA synthetase (AMP-forming)/AMP-acid ligase II
VLHLQLPGSVDAYVQESGRAGRDGADATCTLLYLKSDRALQRFFLAGDTPSAEDIDKVQRHLGGSATEIAEASGLPLPRVKAIASLLRSAGRATLTTEVRIVDAVGREVPLGTVGEVTVRGPNTMLGYWNKPDLTAAVLRNGWMHTGDGGRMDEDGYLYIVDRMKDMIVSGGENVYSAEVENALAQHPAVAASAVIGIPSDAWGEAVHAVVVLKAGVVVTEQELSAHCHQMIAGYKCPRSFEFREALPMTGAGKIQKTELRKPHWAGRTRSVN